MSRREQLSYALVRTLIRVVMALLTRTSLHGAAHLPPHGAGIVVSNHLAAIDPGILVGVLPRPIALMSKAENDHGLLGLFMALVGAFTVRRGAADRRALQTSAQLLQQGRLLCLFPEGTRSRDGRLGPAHGGAALLAIKSGVPIIPVALTGTPRVFQARFPWLGFARVTVSVGAPFQLAMPAGPLRRADRERATAELMGRIAMLLPPELRGAYDAPTALEPYSSGQ
ncbi:MAG: 1-acyl-sn-glycerol-3-phosphate acyltransferase [Kouleothrix sp.]|jgi:1-acyl-sn-glycerol-3-phosphate acyltransferase|nr:1-acyl-sn-glycerol-3-phosphate acyltransferase [Kouleothrix sp.]